MDYRCPKHDKIFMAVTDGRPPGSGANTQHNLPAHPKDGHPDCPLCLEESQTAG